MRRVRARRHATRSRSRRGREAGSRTRRASRASGRPPRRTRRSCRPRGFGTRAARRSGRPEEVVEVEPLGAAHGVEQRDGGTVEGAAAIRREVDRRRADPASARASKSVVALLPRCSAFIPTSVSRSVRPSPAARAAPNDEPYSTSRRSPRCHQTRCGISWTSGWAPVAIDDRQTGVSEGNVVVARPSVPRSASAVSVGASRVPSAPSSIDGVSPSITTRTSFVCVPLRPAHFASVRSPACRSGSFRARRAASAGTSTAST